MYVPLGTMYIIAGTMWRRRCKTTGRPTSKHHIKHRRCTIAHAQL